MVTIECPWCSAPVALERQDAIRCDDCSIQVELAPDPAAEVALAA
jgi:hypothetical protein